MRGRKKLSHGAKLARNLSLCLLLGVLVWGLLGFSAPTVRGRFRLAEGANWAGPRAEEGATLVPRPGPWLDREEVWVVAADVPEGTASARLELTVRCWYRRDGDGWSFDNQAELPWGGPPLTERWEKTYSAQGQLLEDGAVLFRVAAEEKMWEVQNLEKAILDSACQWKIYWMEQDQRDVDCHMEAVFYDRADRELGRAQLATTEQGGAPWTGN